MKKLLIVNNNLYIGGVQKALVSLLWEIYGKYDITLLLFSASGECIHDIPPEVKVIAVNSAYRYLGMSSQQTHRMHDKIGRSFFAMVSRIIGRKYAISLMQFGQSSLEGYDIAISYFHNAGDKVFYGGCNDFVLKHVSASKKITFLHCDYMLCGADTPSNNRMYERFDAIAACSRGCAESFLHINPSLRSRVQVVPNCHRFDVIRKSAKAAPAQLATDRLNIVTVARLGKEKGVERALHALSKLGRKKSKIHYYIIGDGIQKALLQQIIDKKDLCRCVTVCGMLENPYGYIEAADLLLIPSYSEAAPLVIGEAACLGTPILSTETSSAKEMIEQAGVGWVCDNSENGISSAIDMLLSDPALIRNMKQKIMIKDFSNAVALSSFESLINRQ